MSTLGLPCRPSVHMVSASTLPTANCAAIQRVKYSTTSSAARSSQALGAHSAYRTMYEWKSKGVCWRTCRFVQVNGKWNAFSTCLLYLQRVC